MQPWSTRVAACIGMGFIFIHSTKKDQTVHFLSYCTEVNKQFTRNPFPLPKIGAVLQELEGFTFVTID